MIKTDLSDDTFDGYLIAPLQSESVASLIADTEKPVMAFDTDIDSDKCLASSAPATRKLPSRARWPL